MKVIHLEHKQIDRELWDRRVDGAGVTLPYVYSWYLDAVSPGWEALVSDYGYTYFMPLTVKERFGFRYVIQPRWVQQLGLFSEFEVCGDRVAEFLKSMPYIVYDFNLNEGNETRGEQSPNMVIDLAQGYEDIAAGYAENTRRNVRKAREAGLSVKEITAGECVGFWSAVNVRMPKDMHTALSAVAEAAVSRGKATAYGVCAEDGGLVATLLLLTNDRRAVYLAPASDSRGKETRAMFLMVDELLRRYAGTGMTFDFEGSRIEGVARFYEGFGGQRRHYGRARHCRPEWLVRMMHR